MADKVYEIFGGNDDCARKTNNVLLKRIPYTGDYVSVTYPSGERYYLRIDDEDDTALEINSKLLINDSSSLVEDAQSYVILKYLY